MRLFAVLIILNLLSSNLTFGQDTIRVYYKNELIKEEYLGSINNNDTIRLGYYKYYMNGVISQKATYKNNKLEGELYIYYPNKKVKIIYNFKDGLKEGQYKYYDKFTKLRQTGNYLNDELDGEFIFYTFYGKKEKVTHFKNGLKFGIETIINENNIVQSQIEYKADTINGLYETFYDDGNLNYRGKKVGNNFKDSLFVYYQNGDILRKCYYNDGRINGEFITFYEHEVVKSITSYSNGIRIGNFIEYFPDGSIAQKGQFRDNKKDGEWMAFYPEGNMFSKGLFKDNKFHGEWVVYFESGQLKQKGFYYDGKSQGEWSFYHPNGNLWKRGIYVNDKQEGIWYYYNELGESDNIILYTHGVMHGLAMVKQLKFWEKVLIVNGEIIWLFANNNELEP